MSLCYFREIFKPPGRKWVKLINLYSINRFDTCCGRRLSPCLVPQKGRLSTLHSDHVACRRFIITTEHRMHCFQLHYPADRANSTLHSKSNRWTKIHSIWIIGHEDLFIWFRYPENSFRIWTIVQTEGGLMIQILLVVDAMSLGK